MTSQLHLYCKISSLLNLLSAVPASILLALPATLQKLQRSLHSPLPLLSIMMHVLFSHHEPFKAAAAAAAISRKIGGMILKTTDLSPSMLARLLPARVIAALHFRWPQSVRCDTHMRRVVLPYKGRPYVLVLSSEGQEAAHQVVLPYLYSIWGAV